MIGIEIPRRKWARRNEHVGLLVICVARAGVAPTNGSAVATLYPAFVRAEQPMQKCNARLFRRRVVVVNDNDLLHDVVCIKFRKMSHVVFRK